MAFSLVFTRFFAILSYVKRASFSRFIT